MKTMSRKAKVLSALAKNFLLRSKAAIPMRIMDVQMSVVAPQIRVVQILAVEIQVVKI